jgi:hypothetical protein
MSTNTKTTNATPSGVSAGARTNRGARDLGAEVAFLTRALKAPTLRESVPRLAERARSESWSHAVHFFATSRRCQRNIVPGVTNRNSPGAFGSNRTNAANIARSAQSRRGFGLALRNTATSWRRTSSSTSLDADERASKTNPPSNRTKIR